MNRHCPDYYIESSAEQSLADTHKLITHVKELAGPGQYDAQRSLVHPILTPRFAISTTPDLLSSLGALAAKDRALRIQTHISENPQEVTFTRELYPDAPSYAGVYDGAGLLRRGTVLAHAVHLGADELALIAERGAGVAHCPTSNFNLRSGLAPVGEMLDCGIPVAALPPAMR
jgi:guanine deaminase